MPFIAVYSVYTAYSSVSWVRQYRNTNFMWFCLVLLYSTVGQLVYGLCMSCDQYCCTLHKALAPSWAWQASKTKFTFELTILGGGGGAIGRQSWVLIRSDDPNLTKASTALLWVISWDTCVCYPGRLIVSGSIRSIKMYGWG